MAFSSDFLQILDERGFLYQQTNADRLDALLASEAVPSYVGFDCTARSLHVGNLLSIMLLRWLEKTGHKPIALLGGATTRIGDPSGKDETRPTLDDDTIQANLAGVSQSLKKFLGNAEFVNNDEWFSKINYISFLNDVGRHFSVNRMLTMDSVKNRLSRDEEMNFVEFNYMLYQSYDFVELNRRYGCRLQLGGSDQWGNIVTGIDLGRRMGTPELFGVTTPLITTSDGKKMGKSVGGAVWLNEDMLSSYDYWQFWRNVDDADVGRFLKLFTELPLPEIARLEALEGQEINEAKIILANEATTLCHGKEAALKAAETAKQTFAEGKAAENLPTVEMDEAMLAEGIPAYKLLVDAGLVQSGGEARRLIKGGGGKVNDQKIANDSDVITLEAMQDGVIKLSAGKKKHALVKLKDG